MVIDNATWGGLKIHGELLMLAFHVCERWVLTCRRELLDHAIVLGTLICAA